MPSPASPIPGSFRVPFDERRAGRGNQREGAWDRGACLPRPAQQPERQAPTGLVLVTGATGFLGSAVVRALLAEGFAARVLVRPSSCRSNLDGLDVELVEGDILDARSVAAALDGVRYLIHAAADYRLWVREPAAMAATNIEGTRIVMRAALAAGTEKIVYTSSVATLALREDGAPADEHAPSPEPIGPYKRTKIAAERVVAEMIAEEGLPAVIVHPSTPIGPRDIKPTPTGRIIVEAASGRMPAYVDTGLNLVHVDDAAQGHVRALRRGRIGEHYILGGENVPFGAMLGEIARRQGMRPPWCSLPRRMLFPFAHAAEAMARCTGRTPFLTRDGLRMAAHRMFYTDAKARRELGYVTRPYGEAVADAIAWFKSAGYL